MAKEETVVEEKEPMTPAGYDKAVKGAEARKPERREAVARPARVRVTFDSVEEFMEELESSATLVERGIVRYTVRYNPPGEFVGLRDVSLVVGAVVAGDVLELVWRAGQVWGDGGEADQETKRYVDEVHAHLVEVCGRRGMDLRGGRFGPV